MAMKWSNELGKILFITMIIGLFFPIAALADQSTDARIQNLEASVKALQAELDALKAERAKELPSAVDQNQVKLLVDKALESKKDGFGAVPDWVKNIKISGDLRYRYEGIDSQSSGEWGPSINRNRIRARLGLEAKVNDEVNLGFRLAGGSADPGSTNQTLQDSFSKKSIWIDQAYFDWHPGDIKGFDFIGGKMPNPFYRAGNNQLIWDDDLNPEGLAAKYELPLSDSLKAYINGGGFWVGHPDTAGAADTSLWGIQGFLKNTFEDKSYLLGGMSYYTYGNIKDQNDITKLWKGTSSFFGNTSVAGDYQYGYDIVEGFAEYGTKIADYPVAVFGSYAHNAAAPSDKSNGWLIGTTFNKAKDPGSWQIGYDYRDIDSDAVVGQFNDSDFDGGGTNAKGHRFNFTYQLAKNFQAGLTYFLDVKKNDDKDKYHRLQADLVFKF